MVGEGVFWIYHFEDKLRETSIMVSNKVNVNTSMSKGTEGHVNIRDLKQ